MRYYCQALVFKYCYPGHLKIHPWLVNLQVRQALKGLALAEDKELEANFNCNVPVLKSLRAR